MSMLRMLRAGALAFLVAVAPTSSFVPGQRQQGAQRRRASVVVNVAPPPHCNAEFVAECALPTRWGEFRLRSYRDGDEEPTVVVMGDVSGGDVLLRVHDQCFTSEVLGSQRCDCREQLEESFARLAAEGRGVIVYLQQEGRGIGLANKIAAYALQDKGLDTVEANRELGFEDEMRSYHSVPSILEDLGVTGVRLLTNNPFKLNSLAALGVRVERREPLLVHSSDRNRVYLRTKASRMAHIIPDHLLENYDPHAAASATMNGANHETNPPDRSQVFVNPETGKEHRWAMGRKSVEDAIAAIARGEVVVVTDDEGRENEGDLIMAAELATPEAMAFIVRYTGGVICVAMPEDRLEELELPQMVPDNQDPKNTAFTVTVDTNVDTTTGISAVDRAQTMRMLASPDSTPDQFCRPGHIFPLRARDGGVLVRDGHTEASVDLCRLAGLSPAGVLSEVVTHDSVDMARMPELLRFAEEHKLVLTTIEDMICYRLDSSDLGEAGTP